MAGKQVQRRRGTTAQHTTFIGAAGEVSVDTTKHVEVVHDGVTPGGYPQASARDIAATNATVASVSGTANAAYSLATTANTNANTAIANSNANTAAMANKANLNTSNVFSGSGLRFQADMSSGGGTLANRYIFQTSWPNYPTHFTIMPNGSGTGAVVQIYATGNLENVNYLELGSTLQAASVNAARTGSAGYLPLCLVTGGSTRLQIHANGQVQIANDVGAYSGWLTLGSADMASRTRHMRVNSVNNLEVLNQAQTVITHNFYNDGAFTCSGGLTALNLVSNGVCNVAGALQAGSINSSGVTSSAGDIFTSGTLRATTGTANGEVRMYRARNAQQVALMLSETEVPSIAVAATYLISGGVLTFTPQTDGAMALGWGLARWSAVYAVTGSIQTSDAREKTELRAFNAAEMAVAKALANDIGMYQWLDAIETKSADDARLHAGVTAQQVQARFTEHGLDAHRYGLFCFDEWETMEEIVSPEGEVLSPRREAGDRYGVRYEELANFIMRGMAENQRLIEERLAALEAA